MERIKALIDKLHQQAEQQADASTLMVTVQILQEELMRHSAVGTRHLSTSKVAVVLPAGKFSYPRETAKEPIKEYREPAPQEVAVVKQPVSELFREVIKEAVKEPVKEPAREIKREYVPEPVKPAAASWPVKETYTLMEPVETAPAREPARETITRPVKENASRAPVTPEPVIAAKSPSPAVAPSVSAAEEQPGSWTYDPVHEIPTLSHQKEFKEMNDVYGQYEKSLNDKLKTEKTELASVLKEGPIKDLKKAIGVNDRFVFLGELFRGDEAMYERSIKTINNFRIYPEAEYWIERELKVKLGWDENKDAVKHFRQLVRRRFM